MNGIDVISVSSASVRRLTDDVDEGKAYFDDGCVHNVKLTCGKDVQVVIKRCSPEVLVRLLHKMREVC